VSGKRLNTSTYLKFMVKIIRTNSDNKDFIELVKQLDHELWKRYGEEQSFFDRFNKLDSIKHVVVAYQDSKPIGCGAFKEYEKSIAEIKRMYVAADVRGLGIAGKILTDLETWAAELMYSECILETGVEQPEAIRLYEKSGYKVIPNFGQYAGVTVSVCMGKKVSGKQ
jgi:putative acetyltransferase